MTATFHVGKTLTRREQRLFATARTNLLRIEPFGDNGAVRVVGEDFYLLVTELRYLHERDLDPQWQPAHAASAHFF